MKLSRLFRKAVLTLSLAFAAAVGIDSGIRFATRDTPQKLTEMDIKTARATFGDQIDYSKVHIAHHRISFLQPRQTIITLGNTIYWPMERTSYHVERNFIHEMTHVWQNQNHIPRSGVWGALRLWCTTFSYKHCYGYQIDSTKKLTDYNMEQQGDIVSDYHMMKAKKLEKEQQAQEQLKKQKEKKKKAEETTIIISADSIATSLPCQDDSTCVSPPPDAQILPPPPPDEKFESMKKVVESVLPKSIDKKQAPPHRYKS